LASELIFLQNPAIRSLLEQLKVVYSADSRSFSGALTLAGHPLNEIPNPTGECAEAAGAGRSTEKVVGALTARFSPPSD
jgi:hypothetical protein